MPKPKPLLRRALTSVAATILMILPATTAKASDSATTGTATAGVVIASQCNITRGSHRGGYICEYQPLDYTWPDGRKETFIIGWDNAMWHTWQFFPGDSTWSTWQSLGGGFTSRPILFAPSPLTIGARGLDIVNFYCKANSGNGWSANWFRCG